MKVFISWSGDRSKKVAELLDDWIQCVIQSVNPWMSSKDIDRGALWFPEIADQLANTSIGIVCLTMENKNKPWILFESGALAKGLTSNRVCTFLIDLQPTDLENPLAQFNHTFPVKESIRELVRTINLNLKENSLSDSVLLRVFETYWPQFEQEFARIINTTPAVDVKEERNENEIILEVLSTVRTLDKRLRTIESTTEVVQIDKPKFEYRAASYTTSSEIRRQIRQLLTQGFNESQVSTLVREKFNLSEEAISTEIQRVLRSEKGF